MDGSDPPRGRGGAVHNSDGTAPEPGPKTGGSAPVYPMILLSFLLCDICKEWSAIDPLADHHSRIGRWSPFAVLLAAPGTVLGDRRNPNRAVLHQGSPARSGRAGRLSEARGPCRHPSGVSVRVPSDAVTIRRLASGVG